MGTAVYTFAMPDKAQILNHDGAQDVRLPESCRFPDDQGEVIAWRDGARVILEAARPTQWSERFLATLGSWDEEIERPPQTPVTELKNPFD